ncbi:MAG: type III pantothenate kinase [Verrucomicrobia bacterium]|nr:type III pantothenate kinase [Verrucomicrobiota bacterium]
MGRDLVIDIGNTRIKGGVFEEKKLIQVFNGLEFPKDPPIQRALISSVNRAKEGEVKKFLEDLKIPFHTVDPGKLRLVLDVDEPEALGHDRIANAYGALTRFPIYDCIVVDIGTAITVDFVAKEGRYLGGMIYPGSELCAKALSEYTDQLPLVTVKKTDAPLEKTTVSQIQAGIYWGELGAIEGLIDALRMTAISPSSVKVIATGGGAALFEELSELVDLIDPHLTLTGLSEILDELTKKE